jgi:membrane-bound serine protease (ClpP class)
MENDAAAFLRSYVSTRAHNAQAAETAIRASQSFSADEALSQHLIDVISPSEGELLASLDGRVIQRTNGKVTLHLRDARIVTIEPTLREEILGRLANPNLALLLLMGGALLIYLEFNIPGTIIPGALGTVMVLLAVFSLDLLPIRHTALLLLIAAAALLVLELKFASHGILAAAGIVCLAFGTLTLVNAPVPELAIQPGLAISLCVAFGIITFFLLRLALRARRRKALIGPAALVGSTGTAMEPIWLRETQPIGHILVQGEIWQATANAPIPEKDSVLVVGFHDDVLEVQPVMLP